MAGNPNTKISSVYAGLTERRGDRTEWTGQVNFVPQRLEIPIKTRKPTTWFVNSMGDLFHESVTDEQLDQVFAVMALTPQHTYQVLTKRPERMRDYFASRNGERESPINLSKAEIFWCDAAKRSLWQWVGDKVGGLINLGSAIADAGYPLPNVWLGVSTENQQTADERIPLLLQTPAAVRFLSCEPLLGPIHFSKVPGFNRVGLDLSSWWVIVGGESGPKARPCDWDWIASIVAQCAIPSVPCFVKQAGTRPLVPCRMPGTPGFEEFGPIVRTTGKGHNPEEWPYRAQGWPRQMPPAHKLECSEDMLGVVV